jgi:hypothetical protein
MATNFLVGAGDKVKVYVSEILATVLEPPNGGSTRLNGGTQAGFNISADQTDSKVFEDSLGFAYGIVTGQSWDVPWTANLLTADPGHVIVKKAAINATGGQKVGITVEVKNSASTVISKLEGVAIVTNYSEDYPADGILTYNCTFTGYGSPTLDGVAGAAPTD